MENRVRRSSIKQINYCESPTPTFSKEGKHSTFNSAEKSELKRSNIENIRNEEYENIGPQGVYLKEMKPISQRQQKAKTPDKTNEKKSRNRQPSKVSKSERKLKVKNLKKSLKVVEIPVVNPKILVKEEEEEEKPLEKRKKIKRKATDENKENQCDENPSLPSTSKQVSEEKDVELKSEESRLKTNKRKLVRDHISSSNTFNRDLLSENLSKIHYDSSESSTDTKSNETVSSKDFDRLMEKYNALRNLRETEAESLYHQLLESTRQQQEASAKLIEQLRRELAQNEKGVYERQGVDITQWKNMQEKVEKLESNLRKVSNENEQYSTLLEFYEELTGIHTESLGEKQFECHGMDPKCPSRSFHFELFLPREKLQEDREVEYIPLGCTGIDDPPSFLLQHICFQREQLPTFLNKMLNQLHKPVMISTSLPSNCAEDNTTKVDGVRQAKNEKHQNANH